MYITGKFIKLTDSTNQSYYGIDISHQDIEYFITHLRLQGVDEEFISKKLNRDNGHYHITVANTMASNKFKNDIKFQNLISQLIDRDIVIETLGIGHVEVNDRGTDKQAWFVVCKNSELTQSFVDIGILQDLHITIAFNPTDVFRVRKNEDTIIYPIVDIVKKKKLTKM